MAATDPGRPPERRRFITRTHVEDAAAAGQSIALGPRDVITDEAAQRAEDLGVRVDRPGQGRPAGGGAPSAPSVPAASPAASGPPAQSGAPSDAPAAPPAAEPGRSVDPDTLRRAVRNAVVAELGKEPPGLEAAISKVLSRRGQ